MDLFSQPAPSYHHPVALTGTEVQREEANANAQEVVVLAFLSVNSGSGFTATQVWEALKKQAKISHRVPKDSIKRAMSNLKKRNLIEKLNETAIGEYGKPNHLYKIKGV